MVEVFFFLLSSVIVFLLILTLIPKPSRRFDSMGLSLLVKEFTAFGHILLVVSILYACAILFNCSSASFVESSQNGSIARTGKDNKRYKNLDNDPRGLYILASITIPGHREKLEYPIKTPSGKIVKPPKGRCWRY